MREVLCTEVLVEIKQGIGISRAEDEIRQLVFNAYKHDGLEVNVQINTSSHISQLVTPRRPSNLFDVAMISNIKPDANSIFTVLKSAQYFDVLVVKDISTYVVTE